jgi:hypothetical protein
LHHRAQTLRTGQNMSCGALDLIVVGASLGGGRQAKVQPGQGVALRPQPGVCGSRLLLATQS